MTEVMGVLNVTPDSFSDGGRFVGIDAAIARGRELAAQGATIVDVGGESTRPGAVPVPPDEEQQRVVPVIRALAESGIAVSIDTIHAETAEAAVAAGASIVNDVSGGLHDPRMVDAVAASGAEFAIGHWRGIPDPEHGRSGYLDVVGEIREALARSAERAVAAGVDARRIILDPGLGFDKTAEQGWRLLAQLRRLGGPEARILVGISRKRMLGELLDALPEGSRGPGGPVARDLATAVTSALAARAGAWGVRVHDVPGTLQALAVAEAWGVAEAGGPEADVAAVPLTSLGGASPASLGGASLPSLGSASLPSSRASLRVAGSAPAPASRFDGDLIRLTGLEVRAHHGVFAFEREQGQRFLIDAEVSVDLGAAARSDELARTVHYGELAEAISAAVERDPVDLIETVAERAAAVALDFDGVRAVRLTVHKPEAPIDLPFGDVSVTVVRAAAGDRTAEGSA